MGKNTTIAAYAVILIVVVVGIDLLFFRQRIWLWERLLVNIGIVLMFIAFYLRFARNP